VKPLASPTAVGRPLRRARQLPGYALDPAGDSTATAATPPARTSQPETELSFINWFTAPGFGGGAGRRPR